VERNYKNQTWRPKEWYNESMKQKVGLLKNEQGW
jgi:hypothetical protein